MSKKGLYIFYVQVKLQAIDMLLMFSTFPLPQTDVRTVYTCCYFQNNAVTMDCTSMVGYITPFKRMYVAHYAIKSNSTFGLENANLLETISYVYVQHDIARVKNL